MSISTNGDDSFFECVKNLFDLIGSIESPIRFKRWDPFEHPITYYVGLLVINEVALQKVNDDFPEERLAEEFFSLSVWKDSPLATQALLVCKETDLHVICAFSEMYRIDASVFLSTATISTWSVASRNRNLVKNYLPSKKYEELH